MSHYFRLPIGVIRVIDQGEEMEDIIERSAGRQLL
jgi:hypothetical protein